MGERIKHMTDQAILRADVWDASDKHCAYCGKELHPLRDFCIDHVTPKCAGGTDDMSNLVAACRPCNNTKGSTSDRAMCMRRAPAGYPGDAAIHSEFIREERTRRGWSKYACGKVAGVSHVTIAKAEAGGRFRMVTIRKIAKAFGVEPTELLRKDGRGEEA